ncbi:MAG: hypothetical protein WCF04_02215 [Candidatus Nanopelagicales bacterium]
MTRPTEPPDSTNLAVTYRHDSTMQTIAIVVPDASASIELTYPNDITDQQNRCLSDIVNDLPRILNRVINHLNSDDPSDQIAMETETN